MNKIVGVAILIALIWTGCVDVITTIPDVSGLPVITKYEVIGIFADNGVKEKLLDATGFSRNEYSIPLLKRVREVQTMAWSLLIGKSAYSERDRNCVDFANALLSILTWHLPSAPIGIVFYLDFVCSVPGCVVGEIRGHALLVFVTQERELMFIEPRIAGRIYEFDRSVWVTELRMAPMAEKVHVMGF